MVLAKISAESVMPIGIGRHVHDIGAFQNLLRFGCVDVLRPSLGINSLAKIRRMAAVAEIHYVAIAPFHDGRPNRERCSHPPGREPAKLLHSADSRIPVGPGCRDARGTDVGRAGKRPVMDSPPWLNKPGLGVQVDEKALAKYSEENAMRRRELYLGR